MKKSVRNKIFCVLSFLMAASFVLAACQPSGASTPAATESPSSDPYVVWAPLSSNLGDKSFMDSANRGLMQAKDELGMEVRVIPADANDTAAWERNLREAATKPEVDMIVTGGTLMSSTLAGVAPEFPDKKFIIFDAESSGPNVTGIIYLQNEGAFVAGVLAALITKNPDKFQYAEGTNKVGLCTGQDMPVIQDYITGFKDGVAYIDPNIEVDVRFTDDWANPQKGYEVATAMINDGVDVIYAVASVTSIGILEAVAANEAYGIGQDSNQNDLQPGFIAGSAIKSVDATVFEALKEASEGKLEMGVTRQGNIANGGVSFEPAMDIVSADILEQLNQVIAEIKAGKIVPASFFTK